jgi:hypothetical protein
MTDFTQQQIKGKSQISQNCLQQTSLIRETLSEMDKNEVK